MAALCTCQAHRRHDHRSPRRPLWKLSSAGKWFLLGSSPRVLPDSARCASTKQVVRVFKGLTFRSSRPAPGCALRGRLNSYVRPQARPWRRSPSPSYPWRDTANTFRSSPRGFSKRAAWYGPGGKGNVGADLESFASSETALPVGLVVLEHRVPVGVGALKAESLPTHPPPPSPAVGWRWLFLPSRRNRGVGAKLLAALANQAHNLGFRTVYCGTSTAIHLLRRSSWLELERIEHEGKPSFSTRTRTNLSVKPTRSGLRPPRAAYLIRWAS